MVGVPFNQYQHVMEYLPPGVYDGIHSGTDLVPVDIRHLSFDERFHYFFGLSWYLTRKTCCGLWFILSGTLRTGASFTYKLFSLISTGFGFIFG